MPLKKGADVGESIDELRGGKTYARTRKKFGKGRAQRQAVAIALKNRRAKTALKKARK